MRPVSIYATELIFLNANAAELSLLGRPSIRRPHCSIEPEVTEPKNVVICSLFFIQQYTIFTLNVKRRKFSKISFINFLIVHSGLY